MRYRLTARLALGLALVACHLSSSVHAAQQSSLSRETPERRRGESRTLLPDGRVLHLGGRGPDGALAEASLEDPDTGQVFSVGSMMGVPRQGQTATVLADGSVVIVGGVDANGRPVERVELFDPVLERFSDAPFTSARPRTGHAAALLSDGRVLVVGGDGRAADTTLEVWDIVTGTVTLVPGSTRSRQPIARLQPDGTVLVGRSRTDAFDVDLFDPATGQIVPRLLHGDADSAQPAHVTALSPSDGSSGVAVDTVIALRFSRPLPPRQLASSAFTLAGPSGIVGIRVIGAADGQLVFVRPNDALDFDSPYTLRASGLEDSDDAAVNIAPLTFTTAPARDTSDDSDSPWVPDAQSGWQVSAAPSPWESMKPLMARPGETALSGRTLRLDGTPLAGVSLTIDGHQARTDGTGRFLIRLEDAESGHEELWVDGRTASYRTPTRSASTSWPAAQPSCRSPSGWGRSIPRMRSRSNRRRAARTALRRRSFPVSNCGFQPEPSSATTRGSRSPMCPSHRCP